MKIKILERVKSDGKIRAAETLDIHDPRIVGVMIASPGNKYEWDHCYSAVHSDGNKPEFAFFDDTAEMSLSQCARRLRELVGTS